MTSETLVEGSVVRTTVLYDVCYPIPPFSTQTIVEFGPLPPGTYTYEVYLGFADHPPLTLVGQLPLVVTAAPAVAAVPTLDRAGTIVLAAMLCGLTTLLLRRAV